MQSMTDSSVSIFNPDESARILKIKIISRARMTAEIVSELYKAKDFYSASGSRSDLVPDGTRLNTFEAYLSDIGLVKSTAYRWLERYIPEENKLLTYEEVLDKKAEAARGKMDAEERNRSMISEFRKTGTKPSGWDSSLDYRLKKDDEGLIKQKERIENLDHERAVEREKRAEREEPVRFFTDTLKAATEAIMERDQQRSDWKDKIRLSDGGKTDSLRG